MTGMNLDVQRRSLTISEGIALFFRRIVFRLIRKELEELSRCKKFITIQTKGVKTCGRYSKNYNNLTLSFHKNFMAPAIIYMSREGKGTETKGSSPCLPYHEGTRPQS